MEQVEINKIMAGMEDVNREMCRKIDAEAPTCHFLKMMLEEGDSVYGHSEQWWECAVCGHTKAI